MRFLILSGCLLLVASPAAAQQPPPLTGTIDKYINEGLRVAEVKPVAGISDAEFVRRVTHDLAGRIPTTAEVQQFLAKKSQTKRIQLVDRLLASPDFAYHLRNELSNLLMGEKDDKEFSKYLLHAIRTDRSWKQMFTDMLLPSDSDENLKPAAKFLAKRAGRVDDMTNDTSRLFFGVSINCAQCHDHPLVSDWKQDHYFGLSSFFARTFSFRNGLLGEKPYGQVSFKTTKGEQKQAKFMFLSGATVSDPNPPLSKKEQKKFDDRIKKLQRDKKAKPVPPKWSARKALVELATSEKNQHWLARNIVNRTWQRLLGTALIDPADQAHSENPASHPELMDAFVKDFTENNWNLKRLIRAIVLSNTYARSSRWESSGEPPIDALFAVGKVRVLSPQQYALSLMIASYAPNSLPATDSKDWTARREQLEGQMRGLASQFELPTDNFQVSVDEALYFSNSDRFRSDQLRNAKDRIVGHLLAEKSLTDQVKNAYQIILGRAPSSAEVSVMQTYLQDRADRNEEATRQLVWALLTSPQMRFNY